MVVTASTTVLSPRRAKVGARWRYAAWGAATAILVGFGLWYLGDEYAYLNPVLGGGSDFAEYALIMGAGEGTYLVQDFVNAHYTGSQHCGLQVATAYPTLVQRYEPCIRVASTRNLNGDTITSSDYILNYISFRQRFPQTQHWFANVDPIYIGDIHGVRYVEIYATSDILGIANNTRPGG